MKTIKISSLKVGDWIFSGDKKLKTKFRYAQVKGIKVDLITGIDLEKAKVDSEGEGTVDSLSGHIVKLSKKDLEEIEKIKTKIKTVNNL
jgi:hypothetical protein